jgi:methionyl-tRNA formyltransferase
VRVAFAGSPHAAVPVLRALAASEHEVALVISQPDRARGRAGRTSPTPVAEAAEELGLETVRPESINAPEVLERIEGASVAALCVAAFGQIVREPLLSRQPSLNVHYSLLPAYRGAAPVERAIMDGLETTGVTIMVMEAGLDTGPIVSSRAVAIEPEEDAGSLTGRLAVAGGELLVAALDRLETGELPVTPQPEEGVSLAPKLTEADRELDFGRPAADLAAQVRALSPHVGATCLIDGQRFKVWRASARKEAAPAGLSVDGERLLVGCGEGSLEIRELQPPSRSRMAAAAFLRGWRGALELGRTGR